jgi:nucleoid-associated protein YgaU
LRLLNYLILLVVLLNLSACATQPPRYHTEAADVLGRLRKQGAQNLFPAELKSTVESYILAESLLNEKEYKDAEKYFLLTYQKGMLLERETAAELKRRREAERLVELARKAELQRLAQEEERRLAQARAEAEAKAEAEALARREAVEAERRKAKAVKERPLVSSYTVKRGESLPLIAVQPEVYGDRNLWPLIYRANRDQISDPRHIWPGQVLRIPRHLGRDDIYEARRYAQERPLH